MPLNYNLTPKRRKKLAARENWDAIFRIPNRKHVFSLGMLVGHEIVITKRLNWISSVNNNLAENRVDGEEKKTPDGNGTADLSDSSKRSTVNNYRNVLNQIFVSTPHPMSRSIWVAASNTFNRLSIISEWSEKSLSITFSPDFCDTMGKRKVINCSHKAHECEHLKWNFLLSK